MSKTDAGNTEFLIGPKAKEAIKNGMVMTKEYAAQMVEGLSANHRDKLRVEVEAELTPLQREIMAKLRDAKSSEERVKVFAKFADDVGLDPLLSLVPALGDAGSSIVSGLYLLFEAKKADLGTFAYLKIIGLQAADFAVGAIPVVGDVADYFFKANKWSAKSFEKQTEELVEKACEAGVLEDKIAQLTQSAACLPQLAGKGVECILEYCLA
jgi:hypothetical protein